MKKKYVALSLVFVLIFLVGCSFKKQVSEKAIENMAENLIGRMVQGISDSDKTNSSDDRGSSNDSKSKKDDKANVDIDIEDGTFVIETSEGKMSFGSGEWPDSDLADLIPEFKKGNIISVSTSADLMFVTFEEVDSDDYKDYEKLVKSYGFETNYSSTNSKDVLSYAAYSSDEKIYISVMYLTDSKSLTVSVMTSE